MTSQTTEQNSQNYILLKPENLGNLQKLPLQIKVNEQYAIYIEYISTGNH